MGRFKTVADVLLFDTATEGAESSALIPQGTVVEVTGEPRSVRGRGSNVGDINLTPVKAFGKDGFILTPHLKPTDEAVTPAPTVVTFPTLMDAVKDIAAKISALDAKVSTLKATAPPA